MEKRQTKHSCTEISESKDLPVTQKPRKYKSNFAQIRYLMKRLNTALDNKLREGRPSKFCRLCKAELQSIDRRERYPRGRLTDSETRRERNSQNIRKKRKVTGLSSRNMRHPTKFQREVKRTQQQTGDLSEKSIHTTS